jgi:hypothetical protein
MFGPASMDDKHASSDNDNILDGKSRTRSPCALHNDKGP